MKQIYISLIALIVLTFFPGCTPPEVKDRLAAADAVMQARPDSALSILQEIDADRLREDCDKALYGLLYTQALEKNYMNPDNDSLISKSLDYYRLRDDVERLVKAYYYHGAVKFNSGNYSMSVISFMKAMELAEESGDYFWAGMSARGVSDVYTETFYSKEEVAYAEKEYEYFRKSGVQPYLNFSLLDLERAYHNSGNYQRACEIVDSVADIALAARDSILYKNSQKSAATAYFGSDKPQQALKHYRILCENGWSDYRDSAFMVVAYSQIGDTFHASEILDKLSSADSLYYDYAAYNVRKAQGRTDEALQHLERNNILFNRSYRDNKDNGLISSVTDYYTLTNSNTEKELELSNRLFYMSLIVGMLLVLIISSGAYLIYSRQKKKIEEKVSFARQLQELLDRRDGDGIAKIAILKNLMDSKFTLLDKLCGLINESSDNAKRGLTERLSSLISELSISGDKISELEKQVDLIHDNLMTDFRNDLPDLKDADYCLFLFSVLNLSSVAITLLLKESKVNVIYDRRRRLKDKLKRLDDDNKERYLSFL